MVHDCECSIVWPFIQQMLIQGAPATCPTWQRTGERALPGGPASQAGGREVQTINNGTLLGGQWLGQRKEGRQAIRPSCGVTGGGGAGTRAAGARKVRETFERRPVLPGAPWRSGVRVPGRQRTSAEALGGDRLCAPEGEKGQCSRGAHRRAARAVRAASPACQVGATGALGRGATESVSFPKRPRSCHMGFQVLCGPTGKHGGGSGARSEDSVCGGRRVPFTEVQTEELGDGVTGESGPADARRLQTVPRVGAGLARGPALTSP